MSVQRSSIRTVFLVLFIISYLGFGALIFSILEGPIEEREKLDLRSMRAKFLRNNTCLTGTGRLGIIFFHANIELMNAQIYYYLNTV